MKYNPILSGMRLSLITGAAIALVACNLEKERPVRQPEPEPIAAELYLAGEATEGLPDEKLLLSRDGNIHTYRGVLNSGSLYFRSDPGSDEGCFGKGADDNTLEEGSTSPFSVEKGYYEFDLDLESGTFTYKSSIPFGDKEHLYLAGEVITPAWGDHVMLPFACLSDRPFRYELKHYFRKGAYRFHFSTGLTSPNIMQSPEGEFIFSLSDTDGTDKGANNFSLSDAGEYLLTVDLVAQTATFTPIALLPENIEEICVIGNTFGNVNGQVTWWAFWNIYQTPGLDRRMTRDAENPNRFTTTADLTAGQGGIVFTLCPYYQLPMLKRASDTTFEYIISFPGGDSQETVVPDDYLWPIEESGNYTLSVDIVTREVSVIKN